MIRIGRSLVSLFLAICFFLIFNFVCLAQNGVPACSIIFSPILTVTTGYTIPRGQSLSTTLYPDLFNCLGYAYGGSGNSFNLPDLTGKFILGYSSTFSIASSGGEISHTLSITEMPSHNHPANYAVNLGGASSRYAPGVLTGGLDYTIISNSGGGQPHNNLPPYIALVPLIKTINETSTMYPTDYTITTIISNSNLFTMTTTLSGTHNYATGVLSFNPFIQFEPIRTLAAFMILLFIGVGLQKPTSFIIAWIGLALFGIFSYNIPIYWYWVCLLLSTAFIMYRFFNSVKKT
jgi:microcystin-dependent protein